MSTPPARRLYDNTSDEPAEFLQTLGPAFRRLAQVAFGPLVVHLLELEVVLEPQLVSGSHLHDRSVLVHFHGSAACHYSTFPNVRMCSFGRERVTRFVYFFFFCAVARRPHVRRDAISPAGRSGASARKIVCVRASSGRKEKKKILFFLNFLLSRDERHRRRAADGTTRAADRLSTGGVRCARARVCLNAAAKRREMRVCRSEIIEIATRTCNARRRRRRRLRYADVGRTGFVRH